LHGELDPAVLDDIVSDVLSGPSPNNALPVNTTLLLKETGHPALSNLQWGLIAVMPDGRWGSKDTRVPQSTYETFNNILTGVTRR